MKDYNKWKETRDTLKQIPLMPNEPILYFDMEEKTELTIVLESSKAIRYVKFVPTAFRKKPINFTSKPFHSN